MNIKVERTGKDKTYLKVTLREGKNRDIRRVFAKLEHPVISLKRTSSFFGSTRDPSSRMSSPFTSTRPPAIRPSAARRPPPG